MGDIVLPTLQSYQMAKYKLDQKKKKNTGQPAKFEFQAHKE